ncbi:hypothetical protein ACEWY4_024976 [Coilia grayii]|uniref:UPAR/Ly6 domain-containing protein n=1 Tax=Coilia grayii TaxID=363190 RepID=A0ABD1IW98_9TELE
MRFCDLLFAAYSFSDNFSSVESESSFLPKEMSLKTAFTILVLASMLSTADFLKCYTCAGDHCTDSPVTCPAGADRCLKTSTAIEGAFTKTCGYKAQCDMEIPLIQVKTYCCDWDLCNGVGTVAKNLLLLLVPMASIFLLC